jgi:hypothetical protein
VVQVGILAGHTYYFLQDIWPKEVWSVTGKPTIVTPHIVLVGRDTSCIAVADDVVFE